MSVIGEVEQRVRERMRELEPLIDEYRQLEALARTFESSGTPSGASSAATPERRRTRRGPAAGSRANARGDQARALVRQRPGITVAEIVEEMSSGTTYLYRVMPVLEAEGKVKKVNKGYEPTGDREAASAN